MSTILTIDDELDDAEGQFLEDFVDRMALDVAEREEVARGLMAGVDVVEEARQLRPYTQEVMSALAEAASINDSVSEIEETLMQAVRDIFAQASRG